MFDTSMFENPKLKSMDPRKKKAMISLMNETEGKPLQQCVPALMKTSQSLQSQGLNFTPDEIKTLVGLMSASMTPQEQAQANMLMQMMGKMRK